MPTSRTLIQGGSLVTVDPTLGNLVGDVLIEGEKIIEVAAKIPVDPGAVDVVDASQHIVFPGMIDNHRHLYQTTLRALAADWTLFQYCVAMFATIGQHYTPDDMHIANLLGALDAVDGGVTAVFDWSHNQLTPDHTDELIRGLEDAGIRAAFGYGCSMEQYVECLSPPYASTTPTPEKEVRRLRERFSSDDALITLGLAARGPDLSTMEVVRQDWALARELGIRINIHLGQGIFPGRPAVIRLRDEGLLGDDLTFGHCNLLDEEEIRLMADAGVTAVVTPEDECNMGHGWPPIERLIRNGVRPNIGIDTCIAVSGDQFAAMRFALALGRAHHNEAVLAKGENPIALELTTQDVLEFATIQGARALGQEARLGSITPGKQADIVLLRVDDIAVTPVLDPVKTIVTHGHRRAVDHVFVAGRRLKRDGRIEGVDLTALHSRATQSQAALLERAGIHPGWAPNLAG